MNVCLVNNDDTSCHLRHITPCTYEIPRRYWNSQPCVNPLQTSPYFSLCELPMTVKQLLIGEIKPSDVNGITQPGHKARTLAGNLNALTTFWYLKENTQILNQVMNTLHNLGLQTQLYTPEPDPEDFGYGGNYGYYNQAMIVVKSENFTYHIY